MTIVDQVHSHKGNTDRDGNKVSSKMVLPRQILPAEGGKHVYHQMGKEEGDRMRRLEI